MGTSHRPSNRKYQESHPWISFSLNLERAQPRFWMELGEAQSKCRHILNVPLQPEVARQLHQLYLAKGVRATTAIEGNTLTEEQVRQRIDGSLKTGESLHYQVLEIDNILTGVKQIIEKTLADARQGGSPLTVADICDFNRRVLAGLALEEGIVPGEIPRSNVTVGAVYLGAPREDCDYLLHRLTEWLNTGFVAPPGNEIAYAFIKAVISHLYIAWIHPFGDGNGRTARLVEFRLLFEAGVPSPAAHLLSNHYNATRTEYYRQLQRASQSGGDVMPFMQYALTGFVDGLKAQIDMIQSQHVETVWQSFVFGQFKGLESRAHVRQRHIALDLPTQSFTEPLAVAEIRHLTPRLAEAYAGKTSKTISRDLNKLRDMELILLDERGVRKNLLKVLAFLPASTELPWFKPTK